MMFVAPIPAFVPLMDPLTALFPNLSEYWLLLVIPLVLVISIVYRGTRIDRLSRLPLSAALMSVQILVVMTVAAALLYGICVAMTRFL